MQFIFLQYKSLSDFPFDFFLTQELPKMCYIYYKFGGIFQLLRVPVSEINLLILISHSSSSLTVMLLSFQMSRWNRQITILLMFFLPNVMFLCDLWGHYSFLFCFVYLLPKLLLLCLPRINHFCMYLCLSHCKIFLKCLVILGYSLIFKKKAT